MRLLIILMITMISLNAQTDKEIKEKRIRAEGRSATYAYKLYKKKVDDYAAKIEEVTKEIDLKTAELVAMYIKSKCKLRDKCDHNRKLDCSSLKRSMDVRSVGIKKLQKVLEKHEREYSVNKKFMDKKQAYIKELVEMLKK